MGMNFVEKLVVASDKSGYYLKEFVKAHFISKGYEIKDVGTMDPENPVFYPDAASNLAREIQNGFSEKGLLFCGTGMGVSIVANKFAGICAACCESTFSASKARIYNDANVLCMGG
jgi:ribose 5-phosphate isomerase B